MAEVAVGDRVIFERLDGLYDVENVVEMPQPTEEGVLEGTFDRGWDNPDCPLGLETVNRPPLKTLKEAYEIALGHMQPGGHVWMRHHSKPNQVERFFL